ncbi:GspH/FimT family pseudopilin [Microbulbifer sp. TRSA005]|uniref:GspH/FimT family pseudopilin n=1 Tax=unclassified Microbulbifer TaxID=2619833 RepID=UPI0040394799
MTQQGFTLLELIITLALLSILLLIGLPSFTQLLENTRLQTSTEEFFTAVQLTRTNAIIRNQRVTMRNLGSWEQGWEIFADSDNNGERGDKELLILSSAALDKVLIKTNSPVEDYISFISTGESRKAGSPEGALQMGTLHICSQENNRGKAFILSSGGRMRIEEADENDCS